MVEKKTTTTEVAKNGSTAKNDQNGQSKKIVLAFSGGLDTSAIVPWLIETYDAEVITYCADLGNAPNGEYLAQWSEKLGAKEFIFEDLKEEFTADYVYPAIQAGAIYQDDYLLGTALARPLISERMAHFAKEYGAFAIAHGATGKGNDQLRFEKSWAYLLPEVEVIAPWKKWEFTGRSDLVEYLASKGIDFNDHEKTYSVDVNLLHRSCEGGVLENLAADYSPNEVYDWVKPPAVLQDNPIKSEVSIEFVAGQAVALNGEKMTAANLLTELNELAGGSGIGVLDLVEERTIGIKSRGIYETPGGTLLHYAIKQLKHMCWDRQLLNTARTLGHNWADLIYDGLWHSDSTLAIKAFFQQASSTLTGKVTLQIENGQIRVTERQSPFSLFNSEAVSFEQDPEGLLSASVGYSQMVSFHQKMLGKQNEAKKWQL